MEQFSALAYGLSMKPPEVERKCQAQLRWASLIPEGTIAVLNIVWQMKI